MGVKEDIVIEIGQILLRSAKASAEKWDYAGYMFETKDGTSSGGTKFVYNGRVRLPLELDRTDRRLLTDAFKRFREITRVEGDKYWLKCLAVLRHDGELKMLFEFEDWSRWSISPANVERSFEILVGEVFPEALTQN